MFRSALEECLDASNDVICFIMQSGVGSGRDEEKKVVAPSGTKGAKKVGCRNVVVNAPRFLPDVQCTGTLQEPPGTWESRHMPLPFLIRRLLFVVAEKLPVHLTSSASRWHRHA